MTTVKYFIDSNTGDAQQVPSNWDDDRIEFVRNKYGLLVAKLVKPRIKHTITADRFVLFDDWSIYRSYSLVPFFPFFRWGKSISVVHNLIGPQRVLNKMTSQELSILNTTANGGWVVEEDSLVNMSEEDLEQDGAKTGLVMVVRRNAEKPEKIKPNTLPTGHERLAFRAEENIKEISTVGDSQLGFDREDVAAKAIQAKQTRGAINLNRLFSNIAKTRRLGAMKTLELIQDFYTDERIIRITGQNPFQSRHASEDIVINQSLPNGDILNDLTVGKYDVIISTTPSRDTFMETEHDQAIALREAGVAIPDNVLIRSSMLSNKDEILEEMANDPIAERNRQLENAKIAAEVLDKIAAAKKKEAEVEEILASISQEQSGIVDAGERMKRLTQLATDAEKLSMREVSNAGRK